MKTNRLISTLALSMAMVTASQPARAADAAEAEAAEAGSEIIVTGTRRTDRTVAESSVPVDVYSQAELIQQGTADTNSLLQAIVPSFSVQRFAIGDGSSFVRPPNLRGLPPDETLVLVNGKRRHRSALVQLGGGALSEGSQAVDLAQIPAIAISRLEVLRDGASAQYGSDAIAGVINIGLRKETGFTGYARYGQFYRGDGQDYQVAGSAGFELGDRGFINISAEYVNSGETSRGVTRASALALKTAFPALTVRDPAQRYGNPRLEAERVFVNGGFDLTDDSKLYFFGNYGHSEQLESFNFRNSRTVVGVGLGGLPETFGRSGVFKTIFLDVASRDPATGAPVYDVNGRTFNFGSVYPGGFTPQFFGTIDDVSGTAGYKGKTSFGVNYDFSVSFGQDTLRYDIAESINPSLGPDSKTSFFLGLLKQSETNFNADFSYEWDVGFASPVTIAFGGERRREAYELGLGELQSYQIGPYANQLLNGENPDPDVSGPNASQPIGANGFPGYGPDIAGNFSQRSYAFYLDVETDITDALTLGAAVRYERFSNFGGTTNVKGTARYAISPAIAIRGAASTGFRAPTPGQINTSSIATVFISGDPNPTEQATLPVNNPAAIFFGAKPLSPETAVNLTGGIVLTPAPRLTISADYYNIKVKDRIGTSSTFDVNGANATEEAANRAALRALGVANFATLGQVRYLTNAFDTRTVGVDVVASYAFSTGSVKWNSTFGFNYNKTKVTARDPAVVSTFRVQNIEGILPKYRVVFTQNAAFGKFSGLLRANYYSSWKVTDEDNGDNQVFGDRAVFDVEVSYDITENFRLSVGAQNIFDTYPDKDLRGGVYPSTGGRFTGDVYPDSSPFGFNGGFWYGRVGVNF